MGEGSRTRRVFGRRGVLKERRDGFQRTRPRNLKESCFRTVLVLSRYTTVQAWNDR